MSEPMIWHDEPERLVTWGTLDPTSACMCLECVGVSGRRAEPPKGSRTECSNCGQPIVYHPIDLWIHEGVSGDPVPCDGEVPVAEPNASWDWRDVYDDPDL